jgi:hypothetical protein
MRDRCSREIYDRIRSNCRRTKFSGFGVPLHIESFIPSTGFDLRSRAHQPAHRVPCLFQLAHQRASHEPSRTGNQYLHMRGFPCSGRNPWFAGRAGNLRLQFFRAASPSQSSPKGALFWPPARTDGHQRGIPGNSPRHNPPMPFRPLRRPLSEISGFSRLFGRFAQ